MKEIKRKIHAVLFDMDGVIFDTERLAAEGWKEAGRTFGFTITDELIDLNRGCDLRASKALFLSRIGESFPYDQARKLRTDYITAYAARNGAPVKPGVRELFAFLQANGIKKALATSTQREVAEGYFKSAGLPFDFDASVCGTEIRRSKPAPDIFLTAASKLGENPKDCLVIEDSPNGIRAGVMAGCQVIMVPDMTPPDEEMHGLCSAIADSLEDIISRLSNDL